MPPVARLFVVVHVACRYRLFSLLPRHPARPLLLFFQYLMPASWLGTGGLSEGDRVRLALERLGPIFIKFGQLMATRRDMLPPEWTEALARLQDDVTPFQGADARALVEAALGTGRTHQIRVHAQFGGFPLLGDDKYGSDRGDRKLADLGRRRLCLHARTLAFRHPHSGKNISVTAPLDEDFEAILDGLRAGKRR